MEYRCKMDPKFKQKIVHTVALSCVETWIFRESFSNIMVAVTPIPGVARGPFAHMDQL